MMKRQTSERRDVMQIRPYQARDQKEVLTLIQQTIRTVNKKDYLPEKIAVWSEIDETTWEKSLENHVALVVVKQGRILGFGEVTATGYIDRFYVHHVFQGQGIGKFLLHALEKQTEASAYPAAVSITARPFFENQGYHVLRGNAVTLRGVVFLNHLMEKKKVL